MTVLDREVRERNRRIVEVVAGFLQAGIAFEEIYQTYRKGTLTFAQIESFVDDRGKSLLFQMKEICHALFRRNAVAGMEKEPLVDLAIGTIFHEAMKLREDLYQLEVYGAKLRTLEAKEGRTRYEDDFLRQLRKITRRAEVRLDEEMDETRTLFRETSEQLKTLLADFGSNGLLVRFFHENVDLVQKVYGGGGVEDLLDLMYPGGYAQSLAAAGKSYLESARFDRAEACFRQSIERGYADALAPHYLAFSRGMALYYAAKLEEALPEIEQAAAGLSDHPEASAWMVVIARAARRMSPELRVRGRIESADRATAVAEKAETALG